MALGVICRLGSVLDGLGGVGAGVAGGCSVSSSSLRRVRDSLVF